MIETLISNPVGLSVAIIVVAAFVGGIVTGFFKVRKIQPNGFKWKQLRKEALIIAFGFAVTGFLMGGISNFLTSNGWITYHEEPGAWWMIALEFAAYFFLFDTWFYWFHRLMHKEPMYTLVHKWHHYSTSPHALTTFSVNPLESVINGGFLMVFTTVVDVHKESLALMTPFTVLMGLYVHSGYEFLPRWWNKTWATKWFITTTFHDQHHKYFNFNYGGFTTIWDHICGTKRKKFDADWDKLKDRLDAPRGKESRGTAVADAPQTAG